MMPNGAATIPDQEFQSIESKIPAGLLFFGSV
jgi:hypothetical protein